MMDIQEICKCGSGLLYAECHMEMSEASDEDLLHVAQSNYARRWRGNADEYEKQKIYERLASHLLRFGPLTKLIDVGCGLGHGLAELLKHVNRQTGVVVGIDENPECLAVAATRLGIAPPQQRLFRSPATTRNYDMEIAAGRMPKVGPVVLMQADVLRPDDEFEAWIGEHRTFDAVTFWFTGIHAARQHDNIISELEITSDRYHRMANDLAVLDLAGAVLSPGGILHIAQRASANTEIRVRTSTVDEMKALLEHGPFRIADMSLFEYSEPTAGPRIGVPLQGNTSYIVSTILQLEG